MVVRILRGDARAMLASLPPDSVQACVTSPPYYGLRDYGCAGQLGLEATPDEYVAALTAVFREARRVLHPTGVLLLNLGDSYGPGKQLLGMPWRVAFALQADGWWLRSAIVWNKPNPMPESVTDRPTSSYEHVFLLAKSQSYFWDAEAVAEPAISDHPSGNGYKRDARLSYADGNGARGSERQWTAIGATRNARNVLTIATEPFPEAHFATMPASLAEWCVKAATRPGDTVLDPFAGAGTTLLAADRLRRDAIGIELNPDYAVMAERRVRADAPLFAAVEVCAA